MELRKKAHKTTTDKRNLVVAIPSTLQPPKTWRQWIPWPHSLPRRLSLLHFASEIFIRNSSCFWLCMCCQFWLGSSMFLLPSIPQYLAITFGSVRDERSQWLYGRNGLQQFYVLESVQTNTQTTMCLDGRWDIVNMAQKISWIAEWKRAGERESSREGVCEKRIA